MLNIVYQNSQLVQDLGKAFSERIVLDSFLKVEDLQPAGSLKVSWNFCPLCE
jgi:hypothetical protein